jgi:hypothetical protein
MTAKFRPLAEVNHQAIRVLTEQLGIVDALRFVGQFTTGYGNYTEERDALIGHLTLDEILSAIEKRQSDPAPPQAQNPPADEPPSR